MTNQTHKKCGPLQDCACREWISVKERHPAEGDVVLVVDKDRELYVAVMCQGNYCPRSSGLGAYRDITHWTLPELPKIPDAFYAVEKAGFHPHWEVRLREYGWVCDLPDELTAMTVRDHLNKLWELERGEGCG